MNKNINTGTIVPSTLYITEAAESKTKAEAELEIPDPDPNLSEVAIATNKIDDAPTRHV